MTFNKPRVSVVVPAYNISAYIQNALISLQQQSLCDFEVLVVDDGSTDSTGEIIDAFCQQDARFRLLKKANGGLSSARNYGIKFAQSDYIALLDGDDLYEPDKLLSHVSMLERYPDVGVVYSASKIIRDDGTPTFMRLSGKPIMSDPLLSLLCKNFVGHGSNAIFRRCLIDEIGEFDECLASSEDIDFWLRIAALRTWKFYRVREALSCYRVRPTGLSFDVEKMRHCNETVLVAACQRNPTVVEPMLPMARAYLYRYLARLALTGGDFAQARHFIETSLAEDASIFWHDLRSLVTLVAVYTAPITQLLLRRSLGSVQRTEPKVS